MQKPELTGWIESSKGSKMWSTGEHTQDNCEGGGGILQLTEEPLEVGRGEVDTEERRFCFNGKLTRKVIQSRHTSMYLFVCP